MQLQALLSAAVDRGLTPSPHLVGIDGVEVTSITNDSRQVAAGAMYCCVRGETFDGHDFAAGAVAAGATALLCERPLDVAAAQVVVDSVRKAMGPVSSALYKDPSEQLAVVGITGTNGKTTTAHLLADIASASGHGCATIGTLTGARTTPEAPELQARLRALVDAGDDMVAMEVSSHALDLHRVDGTRFSVAVFTNLSQDHLDYHGTMENYFAAKSRLFEADRTDVAVLNIDDVHGRLLRDTVFVPVVGFSLDDAERLEMDPAGSTFWWRGHRVRLNLPGRFNVANALAALSAAVEVGIDPADAAAAVEGAGTVDGRFERVHQGQPFGVAIDYAHTPDGLTQLLAAARELVDGRVIIVFGAGGDRDIDKRPLMGAAASEGADVVFLTTDNPRSEDPAAIISSVKSGIDPSTDLRDEPDRADAIAGALNEARAGDLVLIAGKGHETVQLIGERSVPFDDRQVARNALAAIGWTGPDGGTR